MNPLRPLLVCAALLPALAYADPLTTFQAATHAPLPAHASLYSFADMVRLTVQRPAPASAASAAPALRLAAAQPASAAGVRFFVSPAREDQRWLLFLSGLALAGWVAHRRLVNAL